MKLRALVADHRGSPVDAIAEPHPAGAALLVDDEAWVLADRAPARALGGALAWAVRRGATALHVIAEDATGLLARRAEQLDLPVTIWFAVDRALLPAVVEPLSPPPPARADHLALAPLIEQAGAAVVVEHGVVFGEVRGLEVCRVVDEPTTGHVAEIGDALLAPALLDADALAERAARAPVGVMLEVGVGANDREAFQLLHGDVPTLEALSGVVASVHAHRTPGAPHHPLNRLARERYLRWRIEQQPDLVGLAHVERAEPPVPRPNLRDPVPCVARGADAAGSPIALVCSTGVDLDLIPYVADVQRGDAGLVRVVLPTRDLVPLTQELAGLLRGPVELVAVD